MAEERFGISGPALLWFGEARPGRLRAAAGAAGYRAAISNAMLVAAIGDDAESVDLRFLADRSFVLSLAGQADAQDVIERCLEAIVAECRQPQQGSPLLLSALLRIVLVTMLRVSGGGEIAPTGAGERSGLLRRFRQLVEMNFRNHWPVARYAASLGISADRLHAICTAGIGKSPKALVSERLAREAALRLERSSLTIQQVGHSLGFNDPGHFSAFFKRMVGMPPNRYRRVSGRSAQEGRDVRPTRFADWP